MARGAPGLLRFGGTFSHDDRGCLSFAAGGFAARAVSLRAPRRPREATRKLAGFSTPGRSGHRARRLRVGLVIPLSGPAGVWGPCCQNSAILAAAEINRRGGLFGREVELVVSDGGGAPAEVAAAARRLVVEDGIEAIVGMHISAVRQAMAAEIGGAVPYVYTPLYEGGERNCGVYAIGETPDQQLRPALAWLAEARRAQRWYLIGSDYVWPWVSHRAARDFIAAAGGRVVGEEFLALGSDDFAPSLERIRALRPDAVLVSLVGGDAVAFNRCFAEEGLAPHMLRLSTAIDENILFGIGADNAENLYAAAGYFGALATPDNVAFRGRYGAMFGARAPAPSALGESCYEGMHFLAALAAKAETLGIGAARVDPHGVAYRGARGLVRMADNRAVMSTYLAEADGLDFRILRQF